jgi:hypothetical protein
VAATHIGEAVVVPVRSVQHGVDVQRHRSVVVEENAAVVVEFGDKYRRVGPEVEDVAGLVLADPGEPGLIEMVADLEERARDAVRLRRDAVGRHLGIDHVPVHGGLSAKVRRQLGHQLRPEPDPIRERHRARARALVDLVGFGAEADRTETHAPLGDEAADGAVVAEELPGPRRRQVGVAVEREVVAELVEDGLQAHDLAE